MTITTGIIEEVNIQMDVYQLMTALYRNLHAEYLSNYDDSFTYGNDLEQTLKDIVIQLIINIDPNMMTRQELLDFFEHVKSNHHLIELIAIYSNGSTIPCIKGFGDFIGSIKNDTNIEDWVNCQFYENIESTSG